MLVAYTINKPTLAITPQHHYASRANPDRYVQSRAIAYSVSVKVSTPPVRHMAPRHPCPRTDTGNGDNEWDPMTEQWRLRRFGGIHADGIRHQWNRASIRWRCKVAVPVTLLLGCEPGRLPAASFHAGGAPRAAMTIFGLNLDRRAALQYQSSITKSSIDRGGLCEHILQLTQRKRKEGSYKCIC